MTKMQKIVGVAVVGGIAIEKCVNVLLSPKETVTQPSCYLFNKRYNTDKSATVERREAQGLIHSNDPWR